MVSEQVEVKVGIIGKPKIWSRICEYLSASPCNASSM